MRRRHRRKRMGNSKTLNINSSRWLTSNSHRHSKVSSLITSRSRSSNCISHSRRHHNNSHSHNRHRNHIKLNPISRAIKRRPQRAHLIHCSIAAVKAQHHSHNRIVMRTARAYQLNLLSGFFFLEGILLTITNSIFNFFFGVISHKTVKIINHTIK